MSYKKQQMQEKSSLPAAKIMAVGLNPALQKLLQFSNFQEGQVNRADSITFISGGKAANFAKASRNYGIDSVIYQFSGGITGEVYRKLLEEEKLQFVNQLTQVGTRVCSTILSASKEMVTEIIEPSGLISENEAKQLLARIISDLKNFRGIGVCGTFPPGIKPKFYAKIVEHARKEKIPLLLDSFINIEPALNEGVEILKINLDELKSLTGRRKPETAAKEIFKKYKIKILAVTDGPEASHLFLHNSLQGEKFGLEHYLYHIPKLPRVINPIGAGDTVSAVLLAEYIIGNPIHEAFKIALAAGTLSCLSQKNAEFDINTARKMAAKNIKIFEK